MIEKANVLYKKIVIRWVVFPTLLFIFSIGILVSNILFYDISPSILSFNHNSRDDFQTNFKSIENGDELTGSFTAVEDNLGILTLQFNSLSPVKGTLQFSLHDQNNMMIAYNEYDTRGLYYLNEYPFGFPIIEDSKGKTFYFTIVFFADNKEAQEGLKINESNLITKYKFSSKEVVKNPDLLVNFITKKIIYTLSLDGQTKFYFLYFLPFTILIVFNFFFDLKIISYKKIRRVLKKVKKNTIYNSYRKTLPSIYPYFFILNTVYILFFPFESTAFAVLLISIWIVYLYKCKRNSSATFFHVALLSTIVVPLILFNFSTIIIKTLSLLFLYLVIGLAQSIMEIKLHDLKK